MQTLIISLNIPGDDYQRLYQGTVRDVVAFSSDGRRVRFPAAILRPYVSHSGVSGQFRLMFDQQNRFQAIEKID